MEPARMLEKSLKTPSIVFIYILFTCSRTVFSWEIPNEVQLSESINQQKLGTNLKGTKLGESSISDYDESFNQPNPNLGKVTYLQGSREILQTTIIADNKIRNLKNKGVYATATELNLSSAMESSTIKYRENQEEGKATLSLEDLEGSTSSSESGTVGGDDISIYILAGVAGAIGLFLLALFTFMLAKIEKRKNSDGQSIEA